MPTRHLFADEHATHGRTLCGLDVVPPDPRVPRKPRTYRSCAYCQNQLRKREREQAPVRRHHTDRIAED